jgi:SAM-dependent methyltransferase
MSEPQQGTTYGPYAAVYNRIHGPRLPPLVVPVLEELLLKHVPPGAELLDLCCGTGQITGALSDRGYRMTGMDICEEMLAFARTNAPSCRFLQGDARGFELPAVHHGVLSTSDSMNHIVTLDDLGRVFAGVHRALRDGGLFVFDVLLAERYQPGPKRAFSKVEDDYVMVGQEEFDPERCLSRGEMTLFYPDGGPDGGWRRWDSTSWERFYSAAELESALAAAGFAGVRIHEESEDLGLEEPLDRAYVVARKPAA